MTPQDSTVAKNPLQDFWAKRGGGQLFDMGGLTVIYGICLRPMILIVFLCELLLLHCSHSPVLVSSALAVSAGSGCLL